MINGLWVQTSALASRGKSVIEVFTGIELRAQSEIPHKVALIHSRPNICGKLQFLYKLGSQKLGDEIQKQDPVASLVENK